MHNTKNYQKMKFAVSKQLLGRKSVVLCFFLLFHKQWLSKTTHGTGVPLNHKDE